MSRTIKLSSYTPRRSRSAAYEQVLGTLRRLPPDVVLDVAGREINPGDPESCLCGWAIRASLALAAGRDAADVNLYKEDVVGPVEGLAERYGGSDEEWQDIFGGIVRGEARPVIEAAMIARLFEIVNGGAP